MSKMDELRAMLPDGLHKFDIHNDGACAGIVLACGCFCHAQLDENWEWEAAKYGGFDCESGHGVGPNGLFPMHKWLSDRGAGPTPHHTVKSARKLP